MSRRTVRNGAALVVAGAALGAALIVAQAPAHAAQAGSQHITLYAVASDDGFVNNADDRSRGVGNNPFGNYSNPFTTPPSNEHGYGPFAGDEALISYKLYTGSDLKTQSGTGIFVCQYNFGKNSVCDVSYSLSGGTLVATGAFNFTATTFRLAVTGGISKYRSATGIVDVTPSPIDRQAHPKLSAVIPVSCACRTLEARAPRIHGADAMRSRADQQRFRSRRPGVRLGVLSVALAAVAALLMLGVVGPGVARGAGAGSHGLVIYSVATQEQFINNNDDEARGDMNNPFGTHNRTAAADKENGKGPFPGDEALFSFKLYGSSTLKSSTGTGVFVCLYEFDKNAFCHASFQVDGGTLVASGVVSFDAKRFALAVVGGSGKYSGVTGDIHATPGAKGAQRLAFTLD